MGRKLESTVDSYGGSGGNVGGGCSGNEKKGREEGIVYECDRDRSSDLLLSGSLKSNLKGHKSEDRKRGTFLQSSATTAAESPLSVRP